MKKAINYITLILILVGLQACMDEKGYSDLALGKGKVGVVSIFGTSTGLNLKTYGMDFIDAQQDLTAFTMTGSNLGASTSATIIVDAPWVAKYNEKLAADAKKAGDTTSLGVPIYTPYLIFPADSYTIPAATVTFPAGTSDVDFIVKVNTSKLPLANKYLLPLTISTVSGDPSAVVSGNLKTSLISVVVKNAYEALYETTGFFHHPGVGSSREMHDEKDIFTVSAAKSEAGLADLYPQGYYFRFDVSGTNTLINWQNVGATPVVPSSGFYTADNPGGIAYPNVPTPGTSPWLHSTYNNTYNPTTHTFFMHYGYGGGSTDQNGWSRNVYEKWVRE